MESKTQPKKKAGFNLFDEDDTEAAPPAAPSTSRQSFRGFRPDFSQPPVRTTVPPSANKTSATSASTPATISTFGQQTQQASSGIGSRPTTAVITNTVATKTAANHQQHVPNVASPPATTAAFGQQTQQEFRQTSAGTAVLANATTITAASANGRQPVHNMASSSNTASRPPVTLTSAPRAALITNAFTEAAALPKFNQPRAPGIVSPLSTTDSSTLPSTSPFGQHPKLSFRPFGPRPAAAFNLGQTRVHPVISSSNDVPPVASHEVSPPSTEENGKNKEDNALAVDKICDVEKMRKSLKELGLKQEYIDAAVAAAVKKDEEVRKLALLSTKEEEKESSKADLDKKDSAASFVPCLSNTMTASASKPADTFTNTQQPQRQFTARPPMKSILVNGAADILPLGDRPILTTPPSSKTAATSDVDQPVKTLGSRPVTKTADISSIGELTQTLTSAPAATDSAIGKTTASKSQPVMMASDERQVARSSVVPDKLGRGLMALPNKDFLFKSEHYQVHIHKFVLGARSMYFYQRFFENPASSSNVENVDDFDQEVIELAVKACYDQFFNEASLDKRVAEQLLKFADIYGMPCVKDLLKQTAANYITEENVCSRASHACDTDDSELRQRCAAFIAALITQNKPVPRGIEALPAEFGKEIVLAIAAKHMKK